MGFHRRKFLQMMGISALGLSALPARELWADEAGSTEVKDLSADKTSIAPGKKWGMLIDVRILTEEDCHAAVEACHSVHNVPEIVHEDGSLDKKHEIKWIWTDEYHNVFPEQASDFPGHVAEHRHFLALCNHCTDPPCCRVCPTRATFKRESDGIVVMDMHRCIGCRFCMAGCPYGSRSFNFMDPRPYIAETNHDYPTRSKGVVEKCNFCAERLFLGQVPACVEAVQKRSGALVFGDLTQPSSDIRRIMREEHAIRRKPGLGTGPNVYYII